MAELPLFEVEFVYVGILLTCAIFVRWFLSRVEAAIRRKLLVALAGIGIVGFGYLFAKYPWSGRIKGISLPFGLDSLPLAYVGSACVLIFALILAVFAFLIRFWARMLFRAVALLFLASAAGIWAWLRFDQLHHLDKWLGTKWGSEAWQAFLDGAGLAGLLVILFWVIGAFQRNPG